mmetsp:Transcript_2740/g.3108  ORF Transcript_2740/g.3108 Transcript_2740/m.3108 type:complete len:1037 (+) Transcript_2740:792-3902(+)
MGPRRPRSPQARPRRSLSRPDLFQPVFARASTGEVKINETISSADRNMNTSSLQKIVNMKDGKSQQNHDQSQNCRGVETEISPRNQRIVDVSVSYERTGIDVSSASAESSEMFESSASSMNRNLLTTNDLFRDALSAASGLSGINGQVENDDEGILEWEDLDEGRDRTSLAVEYRERSLSKEGRQKLIEMNAVPKLVQLVRFNEPEVKLNALRALFNLSVVDERTRKQIVAAGAVPLLLSAALEKNSAQPNAVGTLANLATESDIKLIIVSKYHGLEPILSLLKSEDTTVKAHACRALFAIAANDDNKLAIAEAGGLPLLLDCMSSSNIAVQINAAGALANLAIHPYNKPKLVEGGALVIMKRMAYSESDKVQRQIARCLFALAAHTENRRCMVDTNCISALAYMLCIPKEEVQRNAAGALGNVAMSDEFKESVVQSGALRPLILLADSNSESVRRQAARAIFTLSAKEEVKKKIVEVNGLRSIISLTNSSSPDIQRDAAGALANMAIGSENKDLVIKNGGLKPLIHLLHSEQPPVQRQAARAIFALAGGEDNQRLIIQAEGLEPLVDLLQKGEEVQKHAAGALANISSNHPAEVVQLGAVPRLIDLVMHSSNIEVRRQATRALVNLGPEEDNMLSVGRYVGVNGEKQRLRHEMRALYEKTCVTALKCNDSENVAAPTFHDMVLCCTDQEGFEFFIPTHQAVLAARSPFFNELLRYQRGSDSIVRHIVSPLKYQSMVWETALEFIYTDSIRCTATRIKETVFAPMELQRLAHDLQLPRLFCFAQELEAKLSFRTGEKGSRQFDKFQRMSCWSRNMEAALAEGHQQTNPAVSDISIYPMVAGNSYDSENEKENYETQPRPKRPKHSDTAYEKTIDGIKLEQRSCSVSVNKAILAARSSYFRSRFSLPWADSKKKFFEFNGSHRCMVIVLRYIYCASDKVLIMRLKQDPSLALETLFVANEYNLEGLASQCESILIQSTNQESALTVLQEADRTHAPFLKLYCIHFVLKEGLARTKANEMSEDLAKDIEILGRKWNVI